LFSFGAEGGEDGRVQIVVGVDGVVDVDALMAGEGFEQSGEGRSGDGASCRL